MTWNPPISREPSSINLKAPVPVAAPFQMARVKHSLLLIQLKAFARTIHPKYQTNARPMTSPHFTNRENISPQPSIGSVGIRHDIQDCLQSAYKNRLLASGRILRET
jgi:hypothetical protein